MTKAEQRLQREGYASALRSSDILAAIKSGRRGRIAITYFEWARPDYQRVLMRWTVIDGPDDAAAFADAIEAQPTVSEGGTSISAALMLAMKLLETSGLEGARQTIDVSGDDPNNAGPSIIPVRDALLARGVTINGLAISLSAHDAPQRPDYFGGTTSSCTMRAASSAAPALSSSLLATRAEFKTSIHRKLLNEIAGLPVRMQRVTYDAGYPPVTDCRSLGEFRWPMRTCVGWATRRTQRTHVLVRDEVVDSGWIAGSGRLADKPSCGRLSLSRAFPGFGGAKSSLASSLGVKHDSGLAALDAGDVGLAHSFSLEDHGALHALRLHLARHCVHEVPRRFDVLDLDARHLDAQGSEPRQSPSRRELISSR